MTWREWTMAEWYAGTENPHRVDCGTEEIARRARELFPTVV